MNLDQFWADIFSENVGRVRHAWGELSLVERTSVRELLIRITDDAQRIEAQRLAARFALDVIAANEIAGGQPAEQPAGQPASDSDFALPDGALEFARALAHDTAHQLKTAFGRMTADLKRDGTLVTQSDLESDRRLSEAILARYPTHGILSEERDKIFRGQEWCWVIDPIDGTTNFTWGVPAWGVLIGLLHCGQPVLGVADFPMTGEQFYAVRGSGARLNGAPIHAAVIEEDPITGAPRVQKTHLFACCTRTLNHGQPDMPMKLRIVGTTGYDLALVAKGACVGSLDMVSHVWDVAALWPLVHEAGGQAKTNLRPELFPLQAGVDYGALTFSVMAACSPAMIAFLEQHLQDRLKD